MKELEKNGSKNLNKKKNVIILRNEKGITLITLVVTVIVLIILAGISINLLFGVNGLITKAQEAKKQQKIAQIKEKISLELASAEMDAISRNESLEEEQLNDIVSKYGTLQDDKDTILTKDDNYEISLKEIWYGTLSTSGSYSDKKKQIEILEKDLKELQDKYNELEQINSGNSEILNDLRNQITTLENEKKTLKDSLKTEQDKNKELETQIADVNNKYDNLKKEYDKFFNDPGTATEDNILKGKTAWINGSKVTGTIEDRGNLNWNPTTSTTYTVPAGYYNGGTLDSSEAYNAGYSIGHSEGKESATLSTLTRTFSYGDVSSPVTKTENIGAGWQYVGAGLASSTNTSGNSYYSVNFTYSYNSSTGILTMNFNSSVHNNYKVNVFCAKV